MSVDRYFAVRDPLAYHKNSGTKSTKIIIAVCWIAGVMGLLPVFGWNSGNYEGICDFRVIYDFNFVIVTCVYGSFIPTTVLAIINLLIYREVSSQVRTTVKVVKKKLFELLFAGEIPRVNCYTILCSIGQKEGSEMCEDVANDRGKLYHLLASLEYRFLRVCHQQRPGI